MKDDRAVESVLKMHDLHFDSIEFRRLGSGGEKSAHISFQVETSMENPEITGIRLSAIIDKEEDYHLDIKLVAGFSFEGASELSEQMKQDILDQNTIAVMFPYLRSQISLMTSQPDISPLVIPPMNIAEMFKENDTQEETE